MKEGCNRLWGFAKPKVYNCHHLAAKIEGSPFTSAGTSSEWRDGLDNGFDRLSISSGMSNLAMDIFAVPQNHLSDQGKNKCSLSFVRL